MLNKNKIDRKLKEYVREHLRKGYSKHAVKHVLVSNGYNERYVNELLSKHSEIQFVKRYAILISLLFVISIFSFGISPSKESQQKITGYAAVTGSSEGCCTSLCRQTSKDECYGRFAENKDCNELEDCNVGCCIDGEGYCLTNYLYGNCISNYGTNIYRDCSDLVFCKNITDKSYGSRLHNIKDKKGAGISSVIPAADYYESSFNIKYYLYDRANSLSVAAEIKDDGQLSDSIALYDDGMHNDGAKNDNLYGNNWLSSRIKNFDGFKKLDIDIVIRYADGTRQSISNASSIVVLNNNKCLPIYTEWSSPNEKYSIILAADNYEALADGYRKFESDVNGFLDALFFIDKFSGNKGKFNIHRLEQSLSYFNIPTLIGIISNSCPSYSNKKDLVVVLDNNEDYCVKESKRVIRVNPKMLFYKSINDKDVNETFEDMCSYVLTPKKLADQILSFATPPQIAVQTLDNITYNSSNVNLSFAISAANYPVNSSVFLEGALASTKILNEETADIITLNLANGTNAVLIKAVDRNENKAFAQLLLNVTIK